MKNKRASVWTWMAVSMVLLLAAGGILLNLTVPDVETQLAGRKPAILVNINEPFNGQQVLPSAGISVFVHVDSARELQSVQAYADGIPLALILSSPLENSPVTAWFGWSPGTEGWHVLTARATDSDGFTAISNPVRVEAALPPALPPVGITPLDIPMTIFGISSDSPDFETDLDAELERILSLGEAVETLEVEIATFTMPVVELPPEPLPGDIREAPSGTSIFQKFLLWVGGRTSIPLVPPGAPALRGSVEECVVRLWVVDQSENELGFRLFHLGPLDTAWELVADLKASDGTGVFEYVDPDRSPGRHEYYLASYNAGGENPGNIIDLEVTAEACSSHSPRVVSLQNASLTPNVPVDSLYCYTSRDGSNWERIPRNPQEFAYPSDGAFDLSPYLQALGAPGSPLDLAMDCWGWQAGTLVPLGRAEGTIDAREGPLVFDAASYRFSADSILAFIKPEDHPLKLSMIVPPDYFTYADSLAGCHVATGGDASLEWSCDNLYDHVLGQPITSNVVLTWLYYDFCKYDEEYCQGYLPWSEVVGYRVYRQTKNAFDEWDEPILIRTVDRNEVHMVILSPGEAAASSSIQTRYFVRAFSNEGHESEDSNYVQAVPANYHTTIPALISYGVSVRVFKPGKIVGVDVVPGPQGGVKAIIGGETQWTAGDMLLEEQTEDGFGVGYFRHRSEHMPKSVSLIFDTWFQFDLSQVPGTIINALLKWDGELQMGGPGWDKWSIYCGNWMTTFDGWQVGYMTYLLPSNTWGVDVTNLVFLQQQVDASGIPSGGLIPNYFGFYMWGGLRTHYTTEYLMDYCEEKFVNVRLEVEYTK